MDQITKMVLKVKVKTPPSLDSIPEDVMIVIVKFVKEWCDMGWERRVEGGQEKVSIDTQESQWSSIGQELMFIPSFPLQIKRLYSEERRSTLHQDSSDLATQPSIQRHRVTSYHSISLLMLRNERSRVWKTSQVNLLLPQTQ